MNRHIKKIKSIYFFDQKTTYNILEEISSNKEGIIVFYNPECIGISNSAKEMFGKNITVSLCEIFNKRQIEMIAKKICDCNIKQVIFATIAYGYKELAEVIHEKNKNIKIKFLWHGSHSLFVNFNEQYFLESILELQKRGIVSVVGYLKESMANCYRAKGYNSCFVMNDVNLKNFDLDKYEDKKIDNGDNIRIGVYASGDRWEKNTYNQLSACAMVKNAIVDVIPQTKLSISFCKLMNLLTTSTEIKGSLSRKELLERMMLNNINLYVTFTECAPMIPLESFELGVPCLIGNNTSYFKDSKLQDYVVVKEEDSIDEIYEKINICIEKKEEILRLYNEWKKDYSIEAKSSVDDFLKS